MPYYAKSRKAEKQKSRKAEKQKAESRNERRYTRSPIKIKTDRFQPTCHFRCASARLNRRAVPHRRKGRAWRRCHETTNRIPASQPSPEYEQARLDKVARNQQLLAGMSMPQIRGEESAQPRAARTPRCEPLRRGRLHPVVTQLCRRIRNADLAPTRRSARHRATALTPRHSAALVCTPRHSAALVCSSLFSTPCARQGAR